MYLIYFLLNVAMFLTWCFNYIDESQYKLFLSYWAGFLALKLLVDYFKGNY